MHLRWRSLVNGFVKSELSDVIELNVFFLKTDVVGRLQLLTLLVDNATSIEGVLLVASRLKVEDTMEV